MQSAVNEERIAGDTLNLTASFSDPTDVCLLPSERLAVSDQDVGVFLFDKNGQLRKKFTELKGSVSLCYNKTLDQLGVVVYNSDLRNDDPKYQLRIINSDVQLEENRFSLPAEPEIKEGYIRWITSMSGTGVYIITTGDSSHAVIWAFDMSNQNWSILYDRKNCDLQHTCIRKELNWEMYVNKWDETTGWQVILLTLNDSLQVTGEKTIIKPDGGNLAEPWTICILNGQQMGVYDYKTGGIWLFQKCDELWKITKIIGKLLAGQWISLVADDKHLYAACSEEKVIRRFRYN